MNHSVSVEKLIIEFQESVKEIVQEFYDKFDRIDLLVAYRSDKIIPQKGKLNKKVYKYSFHGSGLYAKVKGKEIDFDFGPDNRIDGFDAWRLRGYLESQKKYVGLYTLQYLENQLKILEQEGKIYQIGGYGNYYLRP